VFLPKTLPLNLVSALWESPRPVKVALVASGGGISAVVFGILGCTSVFVFGRVGVIGEAFLIGGGTLIASTALIFAIYYCRRSAHLSEKAKGVRSEGITSEGITDDSRITFANATKVTCSVSKTDKLASDDGILDFAYADPRYAFVADGSGHDNPTHRPALAQFWDNFKQEVNQQLFDGKEMTLRSFQEKLKKFLQQQSDTVVDSGMTHSTFSSAWLIADAGGNPYVIIAHVGDSSLYSISNNVVMRLTPDNTFDPANQGELGTDIRHALLIDIIPVESGDKIIGISDGITDNFTDEGALFAHLKNAADAKALLELPQITKEDDISAFVMVI
jgi:hypothetical protein